MARGTWIKLSAIGGDLRSRRLKTRGFEPSDGFPRQDEPVSSGEISRGHDKHTWKRESILIFAPLPTPFIGLVTIHETENRMEKRSRDGCWTCRLRRKKCDERDEICTPCFGLNLTCHRSSQRPAWMDGGVREKAERVRVKMAVAKAVKNRQSCCDAKPSSAAWRLLGADHGPTLFEPHDSGFQGQTTPPRSLDTPISDRQPVATASGEHDGLNDSDRLADGALVEAPLSHQSYFQGQQRTPDTTIPDAQAILTPLTTHPESVVGDSNASDYFSVQWEPSPLLASDNTTTLRLEPLLPSMTLQEATLMMHYFETTVHWQFQFLFTSDLASDKAWLLWLMANSRPVYLAALASSASHMAISGQNNSLVNADAAGLYYTCALKRMSQSLECYHAQSPLVQCPNVAHCPNVIHILAGITMLLSNVLQGGDTDWRCHLLAATNLLFQRLNWWSGPSLVGALVNTFPTDAGPFNPAAIEGDATVLQVAAAKWIISSVLWFDTASILNSESKPILFDHYIKILRDQGRDASSVAFSNCENWVLLSILQIHDLRIWKRKAQTAGSLSVWALTKRASSIREGLEADIAITYQWLSQRHSDGEEVLSEYMKKLSTYIFACSAAILLETVASGGHPSLPEIQRAVCRTIGALELFPDTDLLRTLVWPLCVSGCLAEPYQYCFFRELVASVTKLNMGNLQNVLEILERCWSLRRVEPTRPDGVTWEDAMASLGRDILLI
ncbi:hypothetical protein FQN51_005224 [Onygenales sp. PD_10]|nr:hypothetical protein FQN51_005224 [Onygenales sp. PD_10]